MRIGISTEWLYQCRRIFVGYKESTNAKKKQKKQKKQQQLMSDKTMNEQSFLNKT